MKLLQGLLELASHEQSATEITSASRSHHLEAVPSASEPLPWRDGAGGTPPMRRGLDQTVVPVRHSVLRGFRFAPGRRPCATDQPSPEPSICTHMSALAATDGGTRDWGRHLYCEHPHTRPAAIERLPAGGILGSTWRRCGQHGRNDVGEQPGADDGSYVEDRLGGLGKPSDPGVTRRMAPAAGASRTPAATAPRRRPGPVRRTGRRRGGRTARGP